MARQAGLGWLEDPAARIRRDPSPDFDVDRFGCERVAGGIAVLRAQRAGATGVRNRRLRLDLTPVVTVMAVEDRHRFRRQRTLCVSVPLW